MKIKQYLTFSLLTLLLFINLQTPIIYATNSTDDSLQNNFQKSNGILYSKPVILEDDLLTTEDDSQEENTNISDSSNSLKVDTTELYADEKTLQETENDSNTSSENSETSKTSTESTTKEQNTQKSNTTTSEDSISTLSSNSDDDDSDDEFLEDDSDDDTSTISDDDNSDDVFGEDEADEDDEEEEDTDSIAFYKNNSNSIPYAGINDVLLIALIPLVIIALIFGYKIKLMKNI